MHLQVLLDKVGERRRCPSPTWPDPIEHLPKRRLGLGATREAIDLRSRRTAPLAAVAISPERLPVAPCVLNLKHLAMLDHDR